MCAGLANCCSRQRDEFMGQSPMLNKTLSVAREHVRIPQSSCCLELMQLPAPFLFPFLTILYSFLVITGSVRGALHDDVHARTAVGVFTSEVHACIDLLIPTPTHRPPQYCCCHASSDWISAHAWYHAAYVLMPMFSNQSTSRSHALLAHGLMHLKFPVAVLIKHRNHNLPIACTRSVAGR
jgi:hypothetical protein